LEKDQTDWTQLIPEKNIKWEINPETNFVLLKKPKFKNPLLKKLILPKLKNPEFSVKLDEVGTFVWQQIDGKNTFAQIAAKMQENFGESIEPVEDRLGQFINSLRQHNFITFLNMEELSSNSN
jgi:hypothetical protein